MKLSANDRRSVDEFLSSYYLKHNSAGSERDETLESLRHVAPDDVPLEMPRMDFSERGRNPFRTVGAEETSNLEANMAALHPGAETGILPLPVMNWGARNRQPAREQEEASQSQGLTTSRSGGRGGDTEPLIMPVMDFSKRNRRA